MNKLIYGEDERLLPWAESRVGVTGFRPDARTIGYERDDELLAVVVFDSFSLHDCNMHIASDGSRRWLTRELLAAAFAFPFIQCGFRRVTGLVPARNIAALKFDEHIGFRREGYHPQAAKDGDLVSLGMLKEWCRFLPKEPTHV
jgi:RimJ/RimL family protein N-acetyltransferase